MSVPAPSPDTWAVVTGASSGIGEALAIELAARGYNLIITARRENMLKALADRLISTYGVLVEFRSADLADAGQRAALASELAERDISILCANAGAASVGPLVKLDPEIERSLLQLNAAGVHDLTLAVLPGMVRRGAGGILLSGSAAGNAPIPYNATYAATKAFINTFCESLRGELLDSGVHVTLLAPGPVQTGALESVDEEAQRKLVPDLVWVLPGHAARASVDGLMRNRMRVVPGVFAKAMSMSNQYLPRSVVAPALGRVYRKLGGGD